MGCGRLFEGTPEQMWQSMLALRDLPDETAVYCGHEYTLSNARFALGLEPDNQQLQRRCQTVGTTAGNRVYQPYPPVFYRNVRLTPFMRADIAGLQAQLGMAGTAPAEVFAEIRQRKDQA